MPLAGLLKSKGRDVVRGLIVAFVAGAFLAFSGAFGSGGTRDRKLRRW